MMTASSETVIQKEIEQETEQDNKITTVSKPSEENDDGLESQIQAENNISTKRPLGNDQDSNYLKKQKTELADSKESFNVNIHKYGNVIPEGMTKSQWKKQQRKLRWAEKKSDFKEKRKEKRKQQKENKKIQRKELLSKIESGEKVDTELLESLQKKQRPKDNPDQKPLNSNLIIDCGFDELMTERERTSLTTQITRAYSENRKAEYYFNLKITSFNKLLKERFDVSLNQYKNWIKNIDFYEQDFSEIDFLKDKNPEKEFEKFVYLTADEPFEKLLTIEPGMTYIVGGIVDKGRYKSLCYDKAKKLGMKTARLPIDEFIKINGRQVITTFHVVDLLLKWSSHKDWKSAFEEVLPQRKLSENRKVDEDENTEDKNEKNEYEHETKIDL
ncbi:tRNA (guanine(9)-N(1))-methyltransferase ASCRUDRAFT_74426 [Ascoidea rubescens DSM 1968]|uniref:tRNA (guanine(9)-N1)-methyltransferase n=1 Tax=Ascoidea rubescens DSM 1968 TaxID=1344418 RepID=A0A1D2VN15_9ASCO|nr:hypothetical protein ASCRUDRAFT_74426 [Ascoidea rubescens DSM 1968]ODV63000.1 hypothetical protein ASCRUDRAFT_74426 [Ascoidea rubescens DSM 1968]